MLRFGYLKENLRPTTIVKSLVFVLRPIRSSILTRKEKHKYEDYELPHNKIANSRLWVLTSKTSHKIKFHIHTWYNREKELS